MYVGDGEEWIATLVMGLIDENGEVDPGLLGAAIETTPTSTEASSRTFGERARAVHDGSIVVGDGTARGVWSRRPNEFRSQMPVYAPTFNSSSTRTAKTNISAVDSAAVLEGVRALDIATWSFQTDGTTEHIGPMAEEFHATFDVGADGESIASVDADGVALAAIQGLVDRVETLEERLSDLEAENSQLRADEASARVE